MIDVAPHGGNETMVVVRLLQNPLGQEALPGERGDIVRVSDGRTRMYLLPNEFDRTSTAALRWMLAREPGRTTTAAATG
jgi:hypothetical protein